MSQAVLMSSTYKFASSSERSTIAEMPGFAIGELLRARLSLLTRITIMPENVSRRVRSLANTVDVGQFEKRRGKSRMNLIHGSRRWVNLFRYNPALEESRI